MRDELLLPFNLQFFAEGDDKSNEEGTGEEEYEVEIIGSDEEPEKDDQKDEEDEENSDKEVDEKKKEDGNESDDDASDDEDDSDESDDDSDDGDSDDEDKEKQVPLSALRAEREKWKSKFEAEKELADIARKLLDGTGKTPEELSKDLDRMEIKKLTDKGMSEEEAKKSINAKKELSKEKSQIKKQKRELEFERLKSDKFYADIDEYKEDVESIADAKNISLKEAYMIVAGEKKLRDKEYQAQFTQPKKKAPKKVKTVAKGETGAKKTKIRLTKEELFVAEMSGMTPKQYYDSKNRNK